MIQGNGKLLQCFEKKIKLCLNVVWITRREGTHSRGAKDREVYVGERELTQLFPRRSQNMCLSILFSKQVLVW